MDKCTELNFETFKYNSAICKRSDFDTDIDPETNFNDKTDLTCNYYTENQFNENIQTIQGVSVIHFNARSMCANFRKIECLLNNLKYKFEVITVSETWFDKHTNISSFSLDNYVLYHIDREYCWRSNIIVLVHLR